MLHVKIANAGYSKNNSYLKNIEFNLNKGEIIGLIGANGAGKSTTIKSILGVIPHFQGEVEIDNEYKLSYIPEEPILYDKLTLWEHLSLAASSYDIPEEIWKIEAEELLKLFHLHPVRNKFPINFSKGMKQKTLIVLGFMIDPDIYIIDEPFIGLDPLAIRNLISLLQVKKREGASILMSTHVLDSAEKICDRFIILSQGEMLSSGDLKEIREESGQPDHTSLLDCFYYLMGLENVESK
ncbi:ABC transporter ATP-binding protein [Pseudalkalibacillus sp. JSM 102089]|uniref:ABC transporter ATP-binding protein n=1 Tax=Pseudalkalibacillus sp. JSM 102089 TaxID=3229856 RepID=UPI003524B09D